MKLSLRTCWLLPTAWLLWAMSSPLWAAAETLVLDSDQGEWPLGHYLQLLEDPRGELDITQLQTPQIARRFAADEEAVPNHGFTHSVYWARLVVRNASGQDGEWLLELGFPNMHRMRLYQPATDGSGYVETRSGVLEPFASRDPPAQRLVFRLPLPAGDTQTLYLRFENGAAMTLPLTLWGTDSWRDHFAGGQLLSGLFYGALLMALGHSLLLALRLRDRAYLWMVLFLISFLLAQASFDGTAMRYLWPNTGAIGLIAVPLLTLLALLTVLRLTNIALDTRQRTPRLHRLTLLWQWLGVAVAAQIPLLDYAMVMPQIAVLVLVSFMTLPVIALTAWRGGYRPAGYFSLAWGTLTVTIVALYLTRLGLLPNNLLTEHGYQFGMVMLTLFVSLGLAERIRELERSRQQAMTALVGVQTASTLGEMAASMAHELNQPLAAISANSGALRLRLSAGRDQPQTTGHGLGQVTDNAPDKLLPIVDQLSADAIRAGETLHRLRGLFKQGRPAVAPVDINASVRETLKMMRAEQRFAGLKLTAQPQAGLPPACADAIQIQQVLMNLVANAADAGSTMINVQTSQQAEDQLLVVVSDNGSGVDATLGEQIFEPFFSTRADGMGMGLAICSTIIKAHGGRLWWQAGGGDSSHGAIRDSGRDSSRNTGGGSRFLFTLPVFGQRCQPDWTD